ncbi:MAG: hypothetical protein LUO86_03085 [Methanomicrobiales archaeon]|nr:hypothetical protein [Methanomicrobiales archaeon]
MTAKGFEVISPGISEWPPGSISTQLPLVQFIVSTQLLVQVNAGWSKDPPDLQSQCAVLPVMHMSIGGAGRSPLQHCFASHIPMLSPPAVQDMLAAHPLWQNCWAAIPAKQLSFIF